LTSILCCIPTYKNQVTGTTLLSSHALAKALRDRGITFGITAISNPDIQWVRNFFLTFWFDKQKDCSHLLFIDDDMGMMPDLVLDMISFGEPLVGTLYPKKILPRQWVVSGIPNAQTRGPFIEVDGLGCGCMLIRRDVVETMLQKMPKLIDSRPNSIDNALFKKEGITRMIRAFDMIETDRGTVSEDISFCRRWRECGGQVWAATHHMVVHVGPHEYADAYGPWAAAEKAKGDAELQARLDAAPILKENPTFRGKLCKRGAFVYDPQSQSVGASMDAYGEWCDFELDLLTKFIHPGDIVIDVGAGIGTHTVAFSQMVGREGKVFAFESSPTLDEVLDANVQINNAGNVFFSNADVVDIDAFANVPGNQISPSVIRIDVTDADPTNKALATIDRCRPVLYVGSVYSVFLASIEERLIAKRDYLVFWHIGPYFNPANHAKNSKNIFSDKDVPRANLICFPDAEKAEAAGLSPALEYQGPDDTWRAAVERLAASQTKQAAE
jgi:hypothetical protein